MTAQPQERDIDQSVLDRRAHATTAAAVVLELHEKSLSLVNLKEHAEEWWKCRQDYVSACSTSAALIAAAFEDAIAEISRLRAQPSPREVPLPIESAPKDGSKALLWMRGQWDIGSWDTDKYARKPRPFWSTLSIWGKASDRANQPKHWLPLPADLDLSSAAKQASNAPVSPREVALERRDHEQPSHD